MLSYHCLWGNMLIMNCIYMAWYFPLKQVKVDVFILSLKKCEYKFR